MSRSWNYSREPWITNGSIHFQRRTVLIPKTRKERLLADDNTRPINSPPRAVQAFDEGLYTLQMRIAKALDRVVKHAQKGCRSAVFGEEHTLIIDRVLTEQDQETETLRKSG